MKKLTLLLLLLFGTIATIPRETRADIAADDARDVYTGNGATTAFTYNFKILDQAHIRVYVNSILQVITTNYTVVGVGVDAGGTVTMVAAPANGVQVLLLRNQPIEQTTSYLAGAVSAVTIERDFDKQTAVDQQQQEEINRSLRFARTQTPNDSLTTVPTAVANKCLGWNSAGTQLQNNDCSGGAGGGGSVHSIDGVNLTVNDPVNFQDTTTIDFTNPSVGNVQATLKNDSVNTAHLVAGAITQAKLASSRGNTSTVQMTTGTVSTDDCAKFDANGNLVTAGAACGAGGGGSFTDVNGTTNEIVSSDSNGPTTTLSLSPTLDLQSKVLQGSIPLVFEGSVADAFETSFEIVNPTADRNIIFPDATGRVVLSPASNGFIVRLAQDSYANQQINGTAPIAVADGSGVGGPPTISITANGIGPTQIDETANYAWTGTSSLSNTHTVTLKDTLFTLQDDGDTTKQAQFQASGITTGTTRTFTLPNVSSTLEVISNKDTVSGYAGLSGGLLTATQVPGNHPHTTSAGAPAAGSCARDGEMMVDTTNEKPYFCSDGAAGNPRAFSSLGDAYNQMSDGVTAVSAVGSETFKFEDTAEIDFTVTAGSPDKLTAALVAASVAVAKVAAPLKTKSITFIIGDRVDGAALTDAHDYPDRWENNIAAMTITEIKARSDAGTPILNIQRNDGTPANICSSNLTATTSGVTCSIDAAEDNLAVGDRISFVMVTAGGTAKEILVSIKATLD